MENNGPCGCGPLSDSELFDPFDLDREEFNTDLFLERYTLECSLKNLLSRKNHIDDEICVLSNDFQNLLYDNYHKFINVQTVISNMKVDFQRMEEKMNNLHVTMGAAGNTSFEILEKLRPTEEKMVKLLKCRDVMKKLVSLTNLVPTLKLYIESGSHSLAARHYLKAENVLNKYKHLSSLNGILKDCAEITDEIKSSLRNKVNCEIYSKKEISESLNLLISLGETPINLLKDFSNSSNKFLSHLLITMDESFSKNSEENDTKITKDVTDYVNFCCNYTEKTHKVMEIATEIFLPRNDLNLEKGVNEFLEELFSENMERLSTKMLLYFKPKFPNIDDDFLSYSLDRFVRKCHILGILTPVINFYCKGVDIMLKVCASRCEFLLEKLKDDFNSHVSKVRIQLSMHTEVSNISALAKEWTRQKLMDVLQSVVVYIRPELRSCREFVFRKKFCKVIVREGVFIAFFRYITNQISLLPLPSKSQQSVELGLCSIFGKYLLDLQDIAAEFFAKVDTRLYSTSKHLCLTTTEDISAEITSTAYKVIDSYIRIRHQNMNTMIQKSMENKNWMKSNEPTRPRAVIKMLLLDIQETKAEAEKIFGTCKRKRGSDVGNAVFFRTYSSDEDFIEGKVLMNKIITKGLELSNAVEPNSTSILNCLVMKVLKSFIQHVRLKTFNRFSLQQIQIDVCYLQLHLYEMLNFDVNIQSLFDEIMFSAYNRTFHPELMNSTIVSVICGTTF